MEPVALILGQFQLFLFRLHISGEGGGELYAQLFLFCQFKPIDKIIGKSCSINRKHIMYRILTLKDFFTLFFRGITEVWSFSNIKDKEWWIIWSDAYG